MSEQKNTTECAIVEYRPVAAALAELRKKYGNVVYDVTTTAGMRDAVAARAEIRTLRTSLEKERQRIKRPALERARLIDDEAKTITAALVELETPIHEAIKEEERRKEEEKARKAAIETARVMAIQDKIDAMRMLPTQLCDADEEALAEAAARLSSTEITSDEYEEFTSAAVITRDTTVQHLLRLQDSRRERRLEEERLAAARREAEEREAELRRREEELERQREADEQERRILDAIDAHISALRALPAKLASKSLADIESAYARINTEGFYTADKYGHRLQEAVRIGAEISGDLKELVDKRKARDAELLAAEAKIKAQEEELRRQREVEADEVAKRVAADSANKVTSAEIDAIESDMSERLTAANHIDEVVKEIIGKYDGGSLVGKLNDATPAQIEAIIWAAYQHGYKAGLADSDPGWGEW